MEYVRELSKSGDIMDIDKTAHSAPDAHAFSDAEFVCDDKNWTFHLMQNRKFNLMNVCFSIN